MVTLAQKSTQNKPLEETQLETVSIESPRSPSNLAQSLTRFLARIEHVADRMVYTDPRARPRPSTLELEESEFDSSFQV